MIDLDAVLGAYNSQLGHLLGPGDGITPIGGSLGSPAYAFAIDTLDGWLICHQIARVGEITEFRISRLDLSFFIAESP